MAKTLRFASNNNGQRKQFQHTHPLNLHRQNVVLRLAENVQIKIVYEMMCDAARDEFFLLFLPFCCCRFYCFALSRVICRRCALHMRCTTCNDRNFLVVRAAAVACCCC